MSLPETGMHLGTAPSQLPVGRQVKVDFPTMTSSVSAHTNSTVVPTRVAADDKISPLSLTPDDIGGQ